MGDKVLSVGGTPCDSSDFDGVMGLIMAAAETGSVSLALGRPKGDDALSSGSGGGAPDAIPDGTVVKLTVIEKGADRVVEGKVGDNLRQVRSGGGDGVSRSEEMKNDEEKEERFKFTAARPLHCDEAYSTAARPLHCDEAYSTATRLCS